MSFPAIPGCYSPRTRHVGRLLLLLVFEQPNTENAALPAEHDA
jgi:hypothetical protein